MSEQGETRYTRHLRAVHDLNAATCATCGELARDDCGKGHALCATCADEPLSCVRCLEVAVDRTLAGKSKG